MTRTVVEMLQLIQTDTTSSFGQSQKNLENPVVKIYFMSHETSVKNLMWADTILHINTHPFSKKI